MLARELRPLARLYLETPLGTAASGLLRGIGIGLLGGGGGADTFAPPYAFVDLSSLGLPSKLRR